MKITPPPEVRSKIELSRDEIASAVSMWLLEKHGQHLHGTLDIVKTTGDGYRAVGELKYQSELDQLAV